MDTVTHVLAGSVMGYAASERYGRAAGAALVMGSVAPDLDNILMLLGDAKYLEYHRVVSNSLPGMVVLSLMCALVAGRIWKDGGLSRLWGLSFLAVFLHVVFDLLNSYGVKPFWPVSDAWYALDSVFIVDPFMTLSLIAGIVLIKTGRRRMRVFGVLAAFIALYVGGRVALHGYAVHEVRQANPGAERVGAFPSPVNPLKWRTVVEYGDAITAGWYSLYDGTESREERFEKPPETGAVRAARDARDVKVFLDFARFPVTTVRELPDGWEVSFTDLRFSMKPGDRRFTASVFVHRDMTHGPGEFRLGSD